MAEWRTPCAGPRRKCWRGMVGSAGLAVWILSISPAPGREPGRGPPSDTGPPAARSAADHGPLSAAIAAPPSGIGNPGEADPWHTNLIRERQVEVRLRSAQRDLEEGHLIGALTSLQSIL